MIPTLLILLLVAFSIFLIGVFVFRPQVTATRDGKMTAFLPLFALPLLCFGMGASTELEHAKSTEFCLSCHIMEPYGTSPLYLKLQLSGIILILGLVVESLCLLGRGPIAFIIFAGIGGVLFAVGILLYLYSLVSAKVEPSKQ